MAKSRKDEAKVKFTAETTEFKQGIEKAETAIKGLKGELRLNSAEMENTGRTTEGLQKRHQLLQAQLEETKVKEENLNSKLQKAIEIYGDNSEVAAKLRKEISYTKAEEEKIKKAISDVNDELAANKKAEEESKSASAQLNEKIEEQQSKLKELKQRYVDVALESGKNSNEARGLQKEMKELNSELVASQNKFAGVNEKADSLTWALDDCGGAASSASSGGFTIFKGVLADLASNVISGCIDACKELGKSVLESGMSFESSMSKVEALSGASADEMEQLKLKAQEMGKTTKFTATESADAFGYMALAGWDTSQMLDGIEGVLNLAAASEMDLATASDIVTDNLSAFGLTAGASGEEVGKLANQLADQMAYAMSHSNTSTEQLGEAWKNCAATSTQLGYSLEDTTAALMVMADSGIKGGEAGTALSSIMTRLGNNVSDCRTMLSDYGIEVYDSEGNVKSLSEILGGMKEVWAGLTDEQKSNLSYVVAGKTAQSELMTVLGESTGSFEEYAAGLSDCSGAASDMSSTMLDNLSGDVTLMQSAFDGLKQTIFEDADGPLRDVAQGITNELIPAAEDMYADIKDGIAWMGEHKTAVEGVALVVGSLATGIAAYNVVAGIAAIKQWALDAAFLASPVTWVVAGLALVVGGFVLLWNKCDGFRQFWIDAWDGITGFFSGAQENISNGIKAVGDFFTGLPDRVQGGIDTFKTNVSNRFAETYSNIDELTGGGLSAVVGLTEHNLSLMKSAYDGAGGGIEGVAAGMMAGVHSLMEEGYEGLNSLTGGKLGNLLSTVDEKMGAVHEKFSGVVDKVKGLFDFDFKWPTIKSPSLDVTWKTEGKLAQAAKLLGFDGLPSFSVKWNANGAILTKPTIFGYANGQFQGGGEAGPEAVLPIHVLENYINNSMMSFVDAIPQIDYNKLGKSVAKAVKNNPSTLVIGEREARRVVAELV